MQKEKQQQQQEKEPEEPEDSFMDRAIGPRNKKPKSGRSRNYYKSRNTNSLSHKPSRPTAHHLRSWNKASIVDQLKYHADDQTVIPFHWSGSIKNTSKWSRLKTHAPYWTSDYYPLSNCYNTQNHKDTKIQNPSQKKLSFDEPRCIHLLEIHPNLYLSNEAYVMYHEKDFDKHHDHRYIINTFSERKMNFHQFLKLMNQVREILQPWSQACMGQPSLDHGSCLVACAAGVNRSVAAVIFWALHHAADSSKSVQDWMNYIVNTKNEHQYTTWDTLTQSSFRHFLSQISCCMVSFCIKKKSKKK